MKGSQRIQGITLTKPYGGHLACTDCGQILGYLSPIEDLKVYLNIRCCCGNAGYLIRGIIPETDRKESLADREDAVVSCPICRRNLFSVTEQTGSFGFRVQCTCGYTFDSTYLREREVYPVRELPNTCLHNIEVPVPDREE